MNELWHTRNFRLLLGYFLTVFVLTGVFLLIIANTEENDGWNLLKIVAAISILFFSYTIPKKSAKALALIVSFVIAFCYIIVPMVLFMEWEKPEELCYSRIFYLVYIIGHIVFICCLKWQDDGKECVNLAGNEVSFYYRKEENNPSDDINKRIRKEAFRQESERYSQDRNRPWVSDKGGTPIKPSGSRIGGYFNRRR